ncbi:hypothetical protein SNEBB_006026 [Seison nebaliae]|nr:hypothetical protein SNEBB_006026 [Seison nebaliae]
MASNEKILEGLDEVQSSLMREHVIMVNENDESIGHDTKLNSHLITNIMEKKMKHRAFSVFLFDEHNRLLLQKRAKTKITYPDMWTNTCCSHPLNFPEETEMKNDLGVKRAAVRKLVQELGIRLPKDSINKFEMMIRIDYQSPNGPENLCDERFGENELDYVLILPRQTVDIDMNLNEVSETKYVNEEELKGMMNDPNNCFTPWFMFIWEKRLCDWWKNLGKLKELKEPKTILRAGMLK